MVDSHGQYQLLVDEDQQKHRQKQRGWWRWGWWRSPVHHDQTGANGPTQRHAQQPDAEPNNGTNHNPHTAVVDGPGQQPLQPALQTQPHPPVLSRLHTLLHLAAWCQLGVLLRMQLAALFGAACATSLPAYAWAPCVTSPLGPLITDLPANILGCFIMGLLASSDAISIYLGQIKIVASEEAPLAALPRRSALQAHTALHVGLRTGLCGSLTTFSSWMLQVME